MFTNQDSGSNDGSDASTETAVEHDGQGLVHDDVAKEQGDQNPMLSFLKQLEDPLGIPLLGIVWIFGDNLEIYAVLAHESDGQAGEGTTQEDEKHGGEVENPEICAVLLLVAVVELLHDMQGSGGGADGEEGFAEGEDGGTEGHEGMAEAVARAVGVVLAHGSDCEVVEVVA